MTTIAPPPSAPPAAVAGPPPSLSPSGRTAVRAVLIVAAVVLLVATLVTLAVLSWGITTFRVITDSKTLPPAMRSLVVDSGSVPVAIRITTDRQAREPRADLRMVNSTSAGANPLSVSADGAEARVTITGEPSEFLQWSRAGEITVVLPPELARRITVSTHQETGVVFAQADLDQLIARTDDGAVVLSGAARRVEIHNVNGKVVTREPVSVSESFTATTVTGDIKVDFTEAAPRTVDVSSQDGDVLVALPAHGRYLVDASTGRDRGGAVVRIPRTTERQEAAAVITARSDTGDVVIDDSR
ncbi:hypothetical protein [Mycolicibacterium holsaticum]|uniref:Adhesin domain-containing protein n=1 Tax=Mycolicibacterium holsaticum TaxID=152142 RepID=A0A1E3R845_9MYCO|nr:hypothetical protein [Mycolicibacterium holsaticum]MDA4105692.1 hypothetical protein [Mycolicibacterium holsaticum DSM 44478 = JCM 12374]ODQ85552.1 hypothetical protein BHQ17_22970 [Mycolicibacterium holsaticum]QZA13933.1 hypothetical protein K3U96_07355 [Mycolicibacterium holsaticum DSM 44478 = JCM 12374]UNC08607.1 hypothetical protein H5U41_19475 [Mycolicibacterium holsaticum DSM 44478 = JCM 12374]